MEERMIENNRVTITGEIVSDFEFDHEVFGEGFYIAHLSSERASGTVDIIPIMVSDRLVDVKADWKGQCVWVTGQFRSYNKHEGNKNKLILSVFASGFELPIEEIEEITDDVNKIYLDGYICKEPVYRTTQLGREISDFLLAVNRPYGKSDYIPCICWGRNAKFAGNLAVGTHISLEGRIQSREYKKKISDDEFEIRTAYEVSVVKIILIEKAEEGK